MSRGFVAISQAALVTATATAGDAGRRAVLDLYEHADRTRYAPRLYTERRLAALWGTSRETMRLLLAALAEIGAIIIERAGDGNSDSRKILVFDPVPKRKKGEEEVPKPEAKPLPNQLRNQENEGETPTKNISKPPSKPPLDDSKTAHARCSDRARSAQPNPTQPRKNNQENPPTPPEGDQTLPPEPEAPITAAPSPTVTEQASQATGLFGEDQPKPKRKPGRPKGSRNKSTLSEHEKPFADAWLAAWTAANRHDQRYPWEIPGRDPYHVRTIATAAGWTTDTPPTLEQLQAVQAAAARYIQAADEGTAWPAGPPTVKDFAIGIAKWLQKPSPTVIRRPHVKPSSGDGVLERLAERYKNERLAKNNVIDAQEVKYGNE